MMSSIDEIRLTAFALGELDGAEHAAVQAYVDQSESARRYVQEIRGTARQVSNELSRAFEIETPVASFSAAQHAAIDRRIELALHANSRAASKSYRFFQRHRNLVTLGLSMAASILIVAITLAMLMPYLFHRYEVAHGHDKGSKDPGNNYLVKGLPTPPDQRIPDPAAVANGNNKTNPPDRHSLTPDNDLILPDDWDPFPPPGPIARHNVDDASTAPPTPPIGVDPLHGSSDAPLVRFRLVQGGHGRPGRAADAVQPHPVVDPKGTSYGSYPIHSVETQTTRPTLGLGPAPDATGYETFADSAFVTTATATASTFPVDVSSAAYSNLRRFLSYGRLPPPETVRIEEILDAFSWASPPPAADAAIGAVAELAPCPWNPEHRLARIVLKARDLGATRPPLDVVFLIDGSESMLADWKLPLLKKAMKYSLGLIGKRDSIAIVGGGHYLPPTSGANRIPIINAIDRLEAGGLRAGRCRSRWRMNAPPAT